MNKEKEEIIIDVDEWYRGLTVDQKEHIANKVYDKLSFDERSLLRARLNLNVCFSSGKTIIPYPDCTHIWLDDEIMPYPRKLRIRNHCREDHDFITRNWSEGCNFSY